MAELRYEAGQCAEHDIRQHLMACDRWFVPPLRERVDIDEYARKLAAHALTIEAWHERVLVGLVAAYIAVDGESCFVSSVSVLPEFMGRGIAATLFRILVEHSACANVTTTSLEVSRRNGAALRLYRGLGFRVTDEIGDRVVMCFAPRLAGTNVAKGPAV